MFFILTGRSSLPLTGRRCDQILEIDNFSRVTIQEDFQHQLRATPPVATRDWFIS